MESDNKKTVGKKGTVVSDKMNKTIVVAVDSLVAHKKYRKRYVSTKRYKVHDEENKFKIGDKVEFFALKPASKGKFYKVA